MELFTFVRMGGEFERISVLALTGNEDLQTVIQTFDSSKATCYDPKDREHLLGVIESGFGSFGPFNAVIRTIFTKRTRTSLASSTTTTSKKPPSVSVSV